MKNRLLFIVLSFVFFLVACNSNEKKESLGNDSVNCELKEVDDQELMKAMLKDFYAEYIIAQMQCPLDLDNVSHIMEKYCTKSLIMNLDYLSDPENYLWINWDPFLEAQDFDLTALQTLKIERDGRVNVYKATYWINNLCITIRLLVIESENGYKIDAILKV